MSVRSVFYLRLVSILNMDYVCTTRIQEPTKLTLLTHFKLDMEARVEEEVELRLEELEEGQGELVDEEEQTRRTKQVQDLESRLEEQTRLVDLAQEGVFEANAKLEELEISKNNQLELMQEELLGMLCLYCLKE